MSKIPYFCISDNELQAEAIAIELALEGFTHHDICVLIPESLAQRSGLLLPSESYDAPFLSALGLLALGGNLPLPGMGVLVAKGPLVLNPRGDMNVAKALADAGVPAKQAATFMREVDEGRILFGVLVRESSHEERVVGLIFNEAGATHAYPFKEVLPAAAVVTAR